MILFLLILMYEPLCAAFGVISQDKMEIRVRKASDETKRINILQALLRFFLSIYLDGCRLLLFLQTKRNVLSMILLVEVLWLKHRKFMGYSF